MPEETRAHVLVYMCFWCWEVDDLVYPYKMLSGKQKDVFEIVLFTVQQGGDLAMPGGIFGYPNLGEGATGIWWVETRDAAQLPTVHCTAPPPPTPAKNDPGKMSVVPQVRNSCSSEVFLKQNSHKSVLLLL